MKKDDGFADFNTLGGEEFLSTSIRTKKRDSRPFGVKPQLRKQQELFSVKNWSEYQQAIFRDVATGEGHVGILARAGSGKTTVILSSLELIPKGKTALMVTFNRDVVKKLKAEAPPGVDALTIHGYGFRELKRAGMAKSEDLSKYKTQEIADRLFPAMRFNKDWMASLAKAVSLAKGELVEFGETISFSEVPAGYFEIERIIDRFGIDDIQEAPGGVGDFIAAVLAVLKESASQVDDIDFDDMVWLPFHKNIPVTTYDFVFIDEAQDFSVGQVELALRACKPGGRIFAVGDDRQAIYGFRGANDYMAVLHRLKARVLPLSISYRCARLIISEAQVLVPDIEVAPKAQDGVVRHNVPSSTMIRDAQAGDFILSRTNAPLIGFCVSLLAMGKRANIQGRDIGKNLSQMVRRSKAQTVEAFVEYVNLWEAKERKRLLARTPVPGDTQAVEDRAACLRTLSQGVTDVSQVTMRINDLFKDETEGIILSTTHKAKGLERDRVWVLQDTYKPKHPNQEEANLLYVAITRAKTSLFFVRTKET